MNFVMGVIVAAGVHNTVLMAPSNALGNGNHEGDGAKKQDVLSIFLPRASCSASRRLLGPFGP
jgi:hypothetical protein